MLPERRSSTTAISKRVLLPLRLFLGVTFAYAGLQKLTDPQFFQASAAGYIGKQIAGYATTSPLHDFLLTFVAPHVLLYGYLVAYGELAIGLATIAGLLLRPAAFFGLLLNILFYLSATWRVYPYFYGSDVVFIFCWLTLLLNGPLNTGMPTLDEALAQHLIQRAQSTRQERLASLFHILLGTGAPRSYSFDRDVASTGGTTKAPPLLPLTARPPTQELAQVSQRVHYVRGQQMIEYPRETRRNFLGGVLVGSASTVALIAITYTLHLLGHADDVSSESTRIAVPPASTPPSASQPGNGTPAASGRITQVSAVPSNSAVSFTIPDSGDPGILVHLNTGQFVAYDALCTHAGCQVDYDPDSHLLVCPCHGAAFDPAKKAEVVQAPASEPLPSVAIHVDSATGAITISNT